jgi:hypothetical protein
MAESFAWRREESVIKMGKDLHVTVKVKIVNKKGIKASTANQNKILEELVAFLQKYGRKNAMLVPAAYGTSGFLVFDNEGSAARALDVIQSKADSRTYKIEENDQDLIILTLYVR